MDISVKKLLEQPLLKKARVLAGQNGLSRKVEDVSVLDSPDAARYLTGVELIVTTGYYYQKDLETFKNIITDLNSIGTPGLGIKTRFFKDKIIPEAVIELCNLLGFPLIELPDDVPYMQINELINLNVLSKTTGLIKSNTSVYKDFAEVLYNEGIRGLLKLFHYWTALTAIYISSDDFIFFPHDSDVSGLIEDFHTLIKSNEEKYVYPGISKIEIKEHDREFIYCKKEFDSEIVYFVLLNDKGSFTKEDFKLLSYILMLNPIHTTEGHSFQEFITDFFSGKYSYTEAVANAKSFNFPIPAQASVIHLKFDDELTNSHFAIIRHMAKKVFPVETVCGKLSNQIFAIYTSTEKESFKKQIQMLYNELKKIFKDISYYIFIGNEHGYSDLVMSQKEALQAAEISKLYELDPPIYFFEDLGFYRLLSLKNFEEISSSFANDYLKKIDSLDNSEMFLETLVSYLNNGLSHSRTAKELYMHPNTIRYRIDIIENNCNIDLNNTWDRLNLELALNLRTMLKMEEKKNTLKR